MDDQIKALNQLTLFREKSETFGTPLAQKSWSKMDAAQWWEYHGSCAPELQRLAMKVVCQTTSATNCERNWNTFSYIYRKTRNKLKYKKLHKLVFTHYNMKLRMRDKLKKSQEEIDANFDPINLDYVFQEDLLSYWIEERENPLLDEVQNAEWLPIVDTDDENVDDNSETNESGGGLSPPSSNSGDGVGNEVDNEGEGGSGGDDDEGKDDELDPYHETPPNYRRYRNLTDMDHSDNLLIETRGNVSQSGRKGKMKQNVPLEDSSSSSIAHSFSDFRIGDSSQSSQQSYPLVYQYSYFNPYNQYPSDQAPPYYQQSTNYHNPYHQQSSDDFFGYLFGQGATQDDNQSENTSYAPSRHSTMW
ncbi:unnamed protein product [Lathyrus oleraceus]